MTELNELFINEKVYKTINPKKYLKDYLQQGIRPENERQFLEYRPCIMLVNTLSKCFGSSLVKIGNTTVLCGIRGEFRKPQRKYLRAGYIQIVPRLPDISCPDSNQKNFGQSVKLLQTFLYRLFIGMNIIDPKDLCIFKGELVWVLNIDVLCMNYDGGLRDAAVIAVYMALKTVELPSLSYEPEKHTFTITENIKEPLKISECPVSTTFGVIEDIILADPSLKEERNCRSIFNILIQGECLRTIHKQGGYQISQEQLKGCTDLAKKRYNIMHTAMKKVLDNYFNSRKK